MELLNQVIISCDIEFLMEDQLFEMRVMIDEISAKSTHLLDKQLQEP